MNHTPSAFPAALTHEHGYAADYSEILFELLRLPASSLAYEAGRRLASLHSGRGLLCVDNSAFDLDDFVAAGFAQTAYRPELPYQQVETDWDGAHRRIYRREINVWREVTWEGRSYDVLTLEWETGGGCTNTRHWILGDSPADCDAFYAAVAAWSTRVTDDEVLVFQDGAWYKSRELRDSIRSANFDNLILPDALRNALRTDIADFLARREQYERYGVPWKRGLLLYGPPGNGKTHALKALLNASGIPCLYVKSFASQYATPHTNMRRVFDRARQTTPCFLVFEDLDALVDGSNRSFFLNELDGFAANNGIITLATTNHPERLDTAILDRPSRFDRKFLFDLPAPEERETYLRRWSENLVAAEMRLSLGGLVAAVGATDGFSFAYLKELMLASVMRWMDTLPMPGNGEMSKVIPPTGEMDRIVPEQAEGLRAQMRTLPTAVSVEAEGAVEVDDFVG